MLRNLLLILFGLSLTACGGTSASYVPNTPVYASSFSDSAFLGDVMAAQVANYKITSTADMPSGSFTFYGYAGFSNTPINNLSEIGSISNLQIDTNFRKGTYSGKMTNFYSQNTGKIQGTVNMTGNIFGNILTGTHDGILSDQSGTGSHSGTMVGTFGTDPLGSGSMSVAGTMTGWSEYSGGGSGPHNGVFVAIR